MSTAISKFYSIFSFLSSFINVPYKISLQLSAFILLGVMKAPYKLILLSRLWEVVWRIVFFVNDVHWITIPRLPLTNLESFSVNDHWSLLNPTNLITATGMLSTETCCTSTLPIAHGPAFCACIEKPSAAWPYCRSAPRLNRTRYIYMTVVYSCSRLLKHWVALSCLPTVYEAAHRSHASHVPMIFFADIENTVNYALYD